MTGSEAPAARVALAGAVVVVTRPLGQSRSLADRIAAAGGVPLVFPGIEIAEPSDPGPLVEQLGRLAAFDWAVFTSPTAVEHGLRWLADPPGWPAGLRAAAVGTGTARALSRRGIPAPLAPAGPRHDSEALLDLPEWASPKGLRVLLFRGEGGRPWLADTLAARGARVEHAVCYRRRPPTADATPLLDALRGRDPAAVVITSSEALHNLLDLLGPGRREALLATPLVTIHDRIAAEARRLGAARVAVSAADDEALVAAAAALLGRGPAQTARDRLE